MHVMAPHSGHPLPSGHRVLERVATMVSRRKLIGGGLVALLAAGTGGLGLGYSSAISAARERLSAIPRSTAQTSFGRVEYAEQGDGLPLLMVHGSGGGFDQGLMFSQPFVTAGYRVVAPSRFGYLGSDYPDDASPDNQADAFAELLDHMRIERVAIGGMSAGALSAIAFALRHPDRCAALLPIVPAAWRPDLAAAQPWSPAQAFAVNVMLRSDFLFWCAITFGQDFVARSILATDPALFAGPEGREELARVSHSILPISERAEGLLNDMRRSVDPPRQDLAAIRVPTLAVSAADDLYFTAETARYIAATVPGGRAVIFPTGGHLLAGRETEMTAAVTGFLREAGYA
jgi:2-hydroxy-6-oxonona-2,4-dienedioate hydrolase